MTTDTGGTRHVELVTVARQFGAGGSEIAAAVGRALGWRVLDREILHATAAHLNTTERDVALVDEYARNTLEKIAASFTLAGPDTVPDATYDIDADTVAKAVHTVIRASIATLPLVVVGHGAQCMFGARHDALHVRVIAPVESRAKRIAHRESMALEEARAEVLRRDKQRERYLKQHFGCDPAEVSLYSMQVNTARMSVGQCVEAILAAVRAGR
jgi:cytidylate kinase